MFNIKTVSLLIILFFQLNIAQRHVEKSELVEQGEEFSLHSETKSSEKAYYGLPWNDLDYIKVTSHYKRLSDKQRVLSYARTVKRFCRYRRQDTASMCYCGDDEYCFDYSSQNAAKNLEQLSGFAKGTEWFSKCNCLPGYQLQENSCQDINECEVVCKGTAQSCENVPGSYVCSCLQGYQAVSVGCEDVDECVDEGVCGGNALCVNSVGSFECVCNHQYTLQHGKCIEKDLCAFLECHDNTSVCVVREQKARCECVQGYGPLTRTRCADLDECNDDVCGEGERCINTVGSYKCECDYGYEQTNATSLQCQDKNECENYNCEGIYNENYQCYNSIGSFECRCKAGYDFKTDCEKMVGEMRGRREGGQRWVQEDIHTHNNILLYTWLATSLSVCLMILHHVYAKPQQQ